MTDNNDNRPRWVNVQEREITFDCDGVPDGFRETTSREVLVEIDWPEAIQRQSEGNRP